ncbi:MAG: HD domain-containing protein [bacterium]|nr:HD domain-containing protein [bacterium]
MANSFEVRDPIYGFITFDEWEKSLIDSQPFQRLRRIQQLALTNYIYPSANHSRFEHSLGVMHLASLMFNSIISDDRNRKLLEQEYGYNDAGILKSEKLIRLAALLHDIGHPPFSHAAEELFPQIAGSNKNYKHEQYSTAIITGPLKHLIEDHKGNSNYEFTAEKVAALIDGNPNILRNFLFWKELIASQLDADKGDYLLRDSHHIGVRYGLYDYNRLLNTLALGKKPKEEGGEIILGVREDGWHIAESVILARYQMFTQVYFHKTRQIYDYHLKEAILEVLEGKKFPTPDKIEEYLKYDDIKIWDLLLKKGNRHSKAILDRDHMREIYKTKEYEIDEKHEPIKGISEKLTQNKIDNYIIRSSSAWYKTDLNKEIMIISKEGEVRPLTEYSEIVKNIGYINQSRLYVWPDNRNKAKEFINEKK